LRWFRGGINPERVHIIGRNEWNGQSGVARGTNPAHGKKHTLYQRIVTLVELDGSGEKVNFFIGELVSDNPLERLAALDDENGWT
jgi:hypothetical protein